MKRTYRRSAICRGLSLWPRAQLGHFSAQKSKPRNGARAPCATDAGRLPVAYGLKREIEGYRANAEPQSTLFYSTNCGLGTRVEFCATPPEILAYVTRVFRQMG